MIEYAMLSGSSEERHDEFNIFHQEISADLETNQENIKIAIFLTNILLLSPTEISKVYDILLQRYWNKKIKYYAVHGDF